MRRHLNHQPKSRVWVANDELHLLFEVYLARYFFIGLFFMVAQKLLELLVFLARLWSFNNIIWTRLQLTNGIFLSYFRKFYLNLKFPLIHFIVVKAQIVKELFVEIDLIVTAIHGEQRVVSLLPFFLCLLSSWWGIGIGRCCWCKCKASLAALGWLKILSLLFLLAFSNCLFKRYWGPYYPHPFMLTP
jgi:hypothetical protein